MKEIKTTEKALQNILQKDMCSQSLNPKEHCTENFLSGTPDFEKNDTKDYPGRLKGDDSSYNEFAKDENPLEVEPSLDNIKPEIAAFQRLPLR